MNIWCATAVFAMQVYACYRYLIGRTSESDGYLLLAIAACVLVIAAPIAHG